MARASKAAQEKAQIQANNRREARLRQELRDAKNQMRRRIAALQLLLDDLQHNHETIVVREYELAEDFSAN